MGGETSREATRHRQIRTNTGSRTHRVRGSAKRERLVSTRLAMNQHTAHMATWWQTRANQDTRAGGYSTWGGRERGCSCTTTNMRKQTGDGDSKAEGGMSTDTRKQCTGTDPTYRRRRKRGSDKKTGSGLARVRALTNKQGSRIQRGAQRIERGHR